MYVASEVDVYKRQQYEASKALGLTGIQTMRYVIVPQMIRTVIPPIAN